MKKIGIIGSRRRNKYKDFLKIKTAFDEVYEPGDVIVSGGCPIGGDAFAEVIAKSVGVDLLVHYPKRGELDKNLPPRAAYAKINYARNERIAKDADVLIACVAEDRKGGTEHTIKCFQKLGKEKLILV